MEEDPKRDLLINRTPEANTSKINRRSSIRSAQGVKNANQVQRASLPEFIRLPSFNTVDADGNGEIEFEEFKKYFPDFPEEEITRIFMEADENQDGKLDRDEFTTWKTKAVDFARSLILPKKDREIRHKDLYDCIPPPIFMFVITAVEIAVFGYHYYKFRQQNIPIYNYGPAPIDSSLIYNPERRYEVWRYLSYFLVHSGYMHIINNVVVQLLLGILLELVHKWWRVLVIYFAGVVAGSLATSVVNPDTYLAGASAGVYALIFAHLSTVILNWNEMEHPWIRVLLFSGFVCYDVGVAFYFAYYLDRETNVGYPAHLGGGIAGLLTGIYILKNVKWERWENYLWYASVVIASFLIVFAVGWNVFKKDYYQINQY